MSWATSLLSTGVPARCVALRVRCPGPLSTWSLVCPLGALCCVCGVVGHLAPVHQCARSVCCVACAVSLSIWLLFTGVSTWCGSVLVRCSGPLGSSSPVCPVCVLRCEYGVLTSWLLFTGVPARFVVLRVRCPGPLGYCSMVCSPGVLCGALGLVTPVHRCARSVCCAGGCVYRASLQGPHSSIRTAAIHNRQGLGTLRACTRPSGRRLFVAGTAWVPPGRTLLYPDGGCSVAGRDWIRCLARTRLFRRHLVLLGDCPHAVVRCVLCALSGFAAPGGRCCLSPVRVPWLWPEACLYGVPRGSAWCPAPRPVRSPSVLRSAFQTPWCLSPPQGIAPPALLAGRELGSLCLPLAPAKVGALRSLCIVPVQCPAMRLSLAGPSGIGLGLRELRLFACVDLVTDASGLPYRLSFDGRLGPRTWAVLCGRRQPLLQV